MTDTPLPHPEQLLPHGQPMVLIDSITEFDSQSIVCRATSHTQAQNPLRDDDGQLSIFAGIEYAAQALAAHARLSAEDSGGAPRRGMIATASKIDAHCQSLDADPQPLTIAVTVLARNSDSSLSEFRVCAGERLLLEGQLTAVVAND